eukprot:TRINITY_DN4506_c0_g1_i2.p1 TRINITY_DN4506_c0_g1~~TRINITY_DN4506_c0_g1_i2.p1  ORF type:complete len:1139 (-),score=270.66 TRINITY_DN4506_c0_g1_i2:138-3554(-)
MSSSLVTSIASTVGISSQKSSTRTETISDLKQQLQLRKGQNVLLTQEQNKRVERINRLYQDLENISKFFDSYSTTFDEYYQKHKGVNQAEANVAELLKDRGRYLKELERTSTQEGLESFHDFEAGAFLNKVGQVGHITNMINEKHCEAITQGLIKPLSSFNLVWSKIKQLVAKYIEARDVYLESSMKILQFNQNKKIVLTKLEKLEQERNEVGKLYDDLEHATLLSLTRLLEQSKWSVVNHVSLYIESKKNSFAKAVETLEKLQSDIDNLKNVQREKDEQERNSVAETQLANNSKWVAASQIQRPSDKLGSCKELIDYLTNSLQFPFSINATRSGTRSPIQISVDLDNRCFMFGNDKVSVDNILNVVRTKTKEVAITFDSNTLLSSSNSGVSLTSSNVLNLSFSSSDDQNRVEKLTFSKRVQWEMFLEAYWFLKQSCNLPVQVETNRVDLREEVRVLCASFNMADAAPNWTTDPIDTWLPKSYDIYCISAQEANYTPRPGYQSCEDDLFGWIGSHLGNDYIKLAGTSLMNIRIVIFIRRKYYYAVSNVKYATVATGIAGIIGNKGAAAVSFSLYHTSFCFLGSHLAARIDRNRLAVRNQNYKDIISRLPFSTTGSDCHHEFDHFFWLGDLNYRIELDRDEIMERSNNKEYDYLLQFDQLLNEKNLGNCFFQFDEAKVNFKPTYRYDRGTREWSLEKMREPAWCDRILWKSINREKVKSLTYEASHELMTSDHSPISAGFIIYVDLPPLPHTRSSCVIKMKNIKGTGYIKSTSSSTGTSNSSTPLTDVYLTFQAPWLSVKNSTSLAPIKKAPEPQWADSQLPQLRPIITNFDYIHRQWIRVIATDKPDPRATILGIGIIPMSKEILEKTDGLHFDIPLSDKGIRWAQLSGNLMLSYQNISISATTPSTNAGNVTPTPTTNGPMITRGNSNNNLNSSGGVINSGITRTPSSQSLGANLVNNTTTTTTTTTFTTNTNNTNNNNNNNANITNTTPASTVSITVDPVPSDGGNSSVNNSNMTSTSSTEDMGKFLLNNSRSVNSRKNEVSTKPMLQRSQTVTPSPSAPDFQDMVSPRSPTREQFTQGISMTGTIPTSFVASLQNANLNNASIQRRQANRWNQSVSHPNPKTDDQNNNNNSNNSD